MLWGKNSTAEDVKYCVEIPSLLGKKFSTAKDVQYCGGSVVLLRMFSTVVEV